MTLRRLGVSLVCLITISTGTTLRVENFFSFSSTIAAAGSKPNPLFSNEPVDRLPETYQGSFLYTTTDEMVSQLKVRLYPEDKGTS